MNELMNIAYKEALKAYKKKEIPVGAIIVRDKKVIAKAHNNRQSKHNILGHAEINAILQAEKKIKDWRLDGYEMYVTLEPCQMCSVVIKESRLDHVYYLVSKEKKSNNVDNITQTNDCKGLKEKYKTILNDFFNQLR